MQPPDAKLPRPVRAVVFDMDGLIFNTEDIYRDAVMAIAAEANHDVPLPFYLSTVGLTGAATKLAFVERFGEGFDYDTFWSAASNRFAETVKSQLKLKAGVVELLDLLDQLGLARALPVRHRARRLRRQQAASLAVPESRGTAWGRAAIMRGAGRFLSRRPLRIGRGDDDHHGARPVSADRRHEGIVRSHRPKPS
jgi:hypothetical protein